MATMFCPSIYGVHIRATEPRINGGDAALCQITLTTCLFCVIFVFLVFYVS